MDDWLRSEVLSRHHDNLTYNFCFSAIRVPSGDQVHTLLGIGDHLRSDRFTTVNNATGASATIRTVESLKWVARSFPCPRNAATPRLAV